MTKIERMESQRTQPQATAENPTSVKRRGLYAKAASIGFLVAFTLSVELGFSRALGEDIGACVSPGYDDIGSDLDPGQIYIFIHKVTVRTDDAERFSSYSKAINDTIKEAAPDNGKKYSMQFAAFFHSRLEHVKIFANAGICDNGSAPITKSTPCRNRNYYFFKDVPPDVAAQAVIHDALSTKPALPICRLRRGSNSQ